MGTGMMRSLLGALAGLALLAPAAGAQTPTVPPGFQVQTTSAGYSQPVGSAYAADGRVFTVRKSGRVYVARTDGTLAPKQILDISDHVNSVKDRGLLGITLDKDFANNGYAYLVYVFELDPLNPDSQAPAVSRLSRIKINDDNTLANPDSPETILLGTYSSGPCPAPDNAVDCIPADYIWHTIGTVLTDPVDGTLWMGSGDTTIDTTSQQAFRTFDERSFAGKIIHIDRNGRGLPGHPFCPQETDLDKVCTKLYAKGFRNPFRFTLRPNKGPVVGDVGHTAQEEIDLLKPGRNYGWPCYQGTGQPADYRLDPKCQALYEKEGTAEGATMPDYSYPHPDGDLGASVTVGPTYTGSVYPAAYKGSIFFGDYAAGWIKRLRVDANDNVLGVEPFAENLPAFTELSQDPGGRLAYVDVGNFYAGQGALRRFDYGADLTPTARATADKTTGQPPLAVQFTGSASTDPEGAALTYDWDFGDGTAHSTAANPAHTYTAEGVYTAKLTVKDPAGHADSATIRLVVGDPETPPVPSITAPVAESTYVTGSRVALQGTATDAEDGALPDSALGWQVILHHNTHLHELATATGRSTSFATDPSHDADSYYEIRLTATDSDGTTATKTVLIRPAKVKYTLNSSPPGATLVYAGHTSGPSPVSVEAATGYKASVAAPPSFVSGGRTYRFDSWSDGGTRTHEVSIPAQDHALVARYTPDGAQTLRVNPSADTTVGGLEPELPKGDSSQLGVDASPAEQSLLRFDVAGVSGRRVVGTRLALHAKDPSDSGGRVFRTASSTWSEATTTWSNRPAFIPGQLGGFGSVRAAEWFEASLAAGAVSRDGVLSLGLDSVSGDGADFASRDSGAKPQLVVDIDPRRPAGGGAPSVRADFDGDGREDVAIAVPEEDAGGLRDSGLVHILYGAAGGLGGRVQTWTQGSEGIADAVEPGDAFGGGLAAGDFNGDGRADLAIGAPGEDLSSVADAGAVHVLPGGTGGLTAAGSRLWTQNSASVADAVGAGDSFGSVLAAGDATGDGKAELAIGAPWEDLGSRVDAGAVHLLRGATGGLTGTGSQYWTQDSPEVAEAAGAGDDFGGTLAFGNFDGAGAADLAVAAPREDLGPAPDAGVVHVLPGAASGLTAAGSQLWSQNSAGVIDAPQRGDAFGSTLAAGQLGGPAAAADLAIGVPAEDHGGQTDAGAVHVLLGGAGGLSADGAQRWTQASAGIPDVAEPGDAFGGALVAGRFAAGSVQALAIGAPGEGLGSAPDAGVVHVLSPGSGGPSATASRVWSQAADGIGEAPGPGDAFGAALAAADATGSSEDELIVGVPGESVGTVAGAGAAHVIPGGSTGLTATGSSIWTQGAPGLGNTAERGDGLGGALGR